MTPKTIISNGLDKNNNTSSPKGLTLLEVLITLAILSIIIISFTTLFTNTNLTINYSGKKTIAVMEGKSILDKISLEAKTFEKIDEDTVKENISEILDEDDYKIFQEDKEEFYRYDKENSYKIHFLIQRQSIDFKSDSSFNIITSNAIKIKILVFYDNGRRKIELSTYIPIGEDIYEK